MRNCPFCDVASERRVMESTSCFAIHDGFPVSRGHTLVIPTKHVSSLYDLPEAEQADLWSTVTAVRKHLLDEHRPAGFNIGVNDGTAAGQTVPHAHIHVIPRYEGDVVDPRGGVRWVLPLKAPYWEAR